MEWPVIWLLLLFFLVHVVASGVVFNETMTHSSRRVPKVRPVLLPSSIWAVAVLFTGIVGLGIYWVMHHSTLNPARSASNDTRSPSA